MFGLRNGSRARRAAFGLILAAMCAGALGCDELFPETEEGAGGAPPDSGCGVTISAFLGTWRRVCTKLSSCYPELQQQGSSVCRAPALNGARISYRNPSDADLAIVEQCLRQFSDQEALESWMCCHDEAATAEVACYASCPAAGNDCVEKGNARVKLCNDAFEGNAQLSECFGGS